MKHLIFFDSKCKMCQNAIRRIRELDKNNIFALWLRAKGEKLYYDRIPITTENRYFEQFVKSGL